AETDVRGTVGRDGMRFQDAARGREDVEHRARPGDIVAGGRDDVAFGVEAHAVDAAMRAARVLAPGEERVVGAEAAGLLDRIRAQLTRDAFGRAALSDIERPVVARYQDAVRLRRIERDARALVLAVRLRVGTYHRAVVELLLFRLVPVALVHGVREPD